MRIAFRCLLLWSGLAIGSVAPAAASIITLRTDGVLNGTNNAANPAAVTNQAYSFTVTTNTDTGEKSGALTIGSLTIPVEQVFLAFGYNSLFNQSFLSEAATFDADTPALRTHLNFFTRYSYTADIALPASGSVTYPGSDFTPTRIDNSLKYSLYRKATHTSLEDFDVTPRVVSFTIDVQPSTMPSPVPLPGSAPMLGTALLVFGTVSYGLKRKVNAAT